MGEFMGILGDKLVEAGLVVMDNHRKALCIAASNWKDCGGTLDDWISVGRKVFAKGKLGEGQVMNARESQFDIADAQPPMLEGRCASVRKDQRFTADGQPIANGEARKLMPEMAISRLPPIRDSVSPMPGEDHLRDARKSHGALVDARQSIAGEATVRMPDEGHPDSASSRDTIAGAEANTSVPEKAKMQLPPARVTTKKLTSKPRSARSFQTVEDAFRKANKVYEIRLNGTSILHHTYGSLVSAHSSLARRFKQSIIQSTEEFYEFAMIDQMLKSVTAQVQNEMPADQLFNSKKLNEFDAKAKHMIANTAKVVAENAFSFMAQKTVELSNAHTH